MAASVMNHCFNLVTSAWMKPLAEHVLARLTAEHVPATLIDLDEQVFADGEFCPQIKESVRNNTVYFFFSPHYPSPSEGIFRIGTLLNALNHASADKIKCVFPYIPYLRQDRKGKAREPITAQFVADVIQIYRPTVRNLITMDMHAEQIQGFFRIPVENLYGRLILAEHLKKTFEGRYDKLIIVAPDVNSAPRAQDVATFIDPSVPYCIIDKRRYRANEVEVMHVVGAENIPGRIAIAIDDMIDTGGTIIGAGEQVRKLGATDYVVCATHGIFSAKGGKTAEDRLREAGVKAIVTNSIPRTAEYMEANKDIITFLPVEPMIAEAVHRDCTHGSVSEMNKRLKKKTNS